ncbi:MAG: Smr/MutS family protein [Bacteroidota bacterium]
MNIGDRVRFLHGREEGIVCALPTPTTAEVIIDGDFRIPVSRNQLTIVNAQEQRYFKTTPVADTGKKPGQVLPEAPIRPQGPLAAKGIYIAFEPFTKLETGLHLINNTDYTQAVTLVQELKGKTSGTWAGMLEPRSTVRCALFYTDTLSAFPVYELRALPFRQGEFVPVFPVHFRLRFKPEKLDTMKHAPVMNKAVWLFQADAAEPVAIDAKALQAQLSGNQVSVAQTGTGTKTVSEVDLHIEKLLPNQKNLKPQELLEFQLKHFEKTLDSAILSGQREITYIHGAGNGTLKAELHRRLGKHPAVEYFEDAAREKFGWGATKVKLR